MTSAISELEQFFAGGAKSAKFEDRAYGSVIGGEIVEEPVMRQQRDYETDTPMTYSDGNPVMQMVVVVQAQPASADDDGRRALYVRGQLKAAVGEALRKAGARVPQRGGKLWVKYVSDEPVTLKNGKRGNDKKIYAAKYEAPAVAAAAAFYDATPTQVSAAPAGIAPEQWAAMSEGQREQLTAALRPQPADTEPPF